MATDALGLDSFGGFAAGTIEEQHQRQAELAREVVDDLDGSTAVVVEEAAVRAQSAELDGKATAVIGAAALCNHGQVFWREAPMPRQLVFARVERRRHGRFRVKSTESHPWSFLTVRFRSDGPSAPTVASATA